MNVDLKTNEKKNILFREFIVLYMNFTSLKLQRVRNVFDGYCKSVPTFADHIDSLVETLFSILNDSDLPHEQMRQVVAVLKHRISADMYKELINFIDPNYDFPAKVIKKKINVST